MHNVLKKSDIDISKEKFRWVIPSFLLMPKFKTSNVTLKVKIPKAENAHPTAKISIDGLNGASCATCISPPCS